jgi:hypothetical protein
MQFVLLPYLSEYHIAFQATGLKVIVAAFILYKFWPEGDDEGIWLVLAVDPIVGDKHMPVELFDCVTKLVVDGGDVAWLLALVLLECTDCFQTPQHSSHCHYIIMLARYFMITENQFQV